MEIERERVGRLEWRRGWVSCDDINIMNIMFQKETMKRPNQALRCQGVKHVQVGLVDSWCFRHVQII